MAKKPKLELPAHYVELCGLLREAAHVSSIGACLSWDQETYMPAAGAAARAEQSSIIASLAHSKRTSPKIKDLLAKCENDTSLNDVTTATGANLREIRRDYNLATKLPNELVAELAKVGSQSQEAWKHAREKSDFKQFAPWLEKMMTLSRRKAECYGIPKNETGAKGEIYDALLNEYEPGASAADLAATFAPLRERLTDLIAQVGEKKAAKGKSRVKVDTSCLTTKVDAKLQHEFGHTVLEAMKFDLNAGRLDVTTHPFCSGFAYGDTRLTTRYRDEKFTDALYGTMHEAGHGLYEQGLPKGESDGAGLLFGQPLADAISLGIHESQSRMWENFVGRSREFWKWALPKIQKKFGPSFKKYTVEDLYRATNTVNPSLIRVEADEATYNLHVMVRFELERGLLSGDLKVKDLPGEWNSKYASMLGIDVPDDRRGCLQDVHWSFGLIGYFPTYTLGNLYAAQLWEKINKDLPTLNKDIAKGEMGELREWLRKNIHRHGRRYGAGELCKKVTGKPLSAEPLLRHLSAKARDVYGVEGV